MTSSATVLVPTRHLRWMEMGADHLRERLAGLSEEQLLAPGPLPGWTGRHVLAHLSGNARALQRLARWAATGVPIPMYADKAERASEIERDATLPAAALRIGVERTQEELRSSLEALPPHAWTSMVVTAQGRQVPASLIPWLRVRELWIHAADLDGSRFDDFPPELLLELIQDVLARRRQVHGEKLEVRPTDAAIPEPPASDHWFQGTAADLARWLTGRGFEGVCRSDGQPLPSLKPWL